MNPRTVKIQKTKSGGGSFSSAVCPYCPKSKILEGIELTTMYVVCSGCGKKYLLAN